MRQASPPTYAALASGSQVSRAGCQAGQVHRRIQSGNRSLTSGESQREIPRPQGARRTRPGKGRRCRGRNPRQVEWQRPLTRQPGRNLDPERRPGDVSSRIEPAAEMHGMTQSGRPPPSLNPFERLPARPDCATTAFGRRMRRLSTRCSLSIFRSRSRKAVSQIQLKALLRTLDSQRTAVPIDPNRTSVAFRRYRPIPPVNDPEISLRPANCQRHHLGDGRLTKSGIKHCLGNP